jgi:hypothetical protein
LAALLLQQRRHRHAEGFGEALEHTDRGIRTARLEPEDIGATHRAFLASSVGPSPFASRIFLSFISIRLGLMVYYIGL